ncbi:MAG TPA: alpha-L-arabinofuranosidase [Parafilimonas sp.]|nr:alpha-L-arabinofuranosidase [Parafilimonas sp.]
MKKRIGVIMLAVCILFSFCKKEVGGDDNGGGTNPPPDDTIPVVITPTDPALAGSIGFFMDNWQAKTFIAPDAKDTAAPASANITVTVDASTILTKISPSLFGNNANLWMGDFSNNALLQYITDLKPKIIRFPGGSISDVFFWNAQKDVKPADAPATLVDANGVAAPAGYWYGKNNESWTCSVEKYYQMLQQTGSEGLITINYGYARYGTSADPVAAAAHLAADWVRYDNGRTKYWEIGNENHGTWEAGYRIDLSQNKDGQPQIITGSLYGSHFQVFSDSMKKAANEIGTTIYIGSLLLSQTPQSWQTETEKNWNQGVLSVAGNTADYLITHDYFTPYQTNASPAEVLSSATTIPATVMSYLDQSRQSAGVSSKPIALTEWNIFSQGSQQMVSYVAGMHAVLTINELMKNKFGMSGRWDLANAWDNGNDHGMFSQGGEPNVPMWNPRPAFYYYYFLQKMLGDRCINASVTGGNNINAYASTFSSGQVGVTLVNQSSSAQTIKLAYKNFNAGDKFYWYTLTGGTDNGSFSRKVYVNGQGTALPAGGPANYASVKAYSASAANGVYITLPPMSVVFMVVDKK